MGLLTSATKETHYVMKWLFGGYEPGRHIRCVGEPYEWLSRFAQVTTEPYPTNPEDTAIVNKSRDEADARMVAEAMAAAVRPDRHLTSAELQKKIPALRDAANYDLARTQFGFPASIKVSVPGSRDVEHRWSEQAADRWLSDLQTKAAQIRIFVP